MTPLLTHPSYCSLAQNHRYNGTRIMMTSSNGNIFRVTGHLCGEITGPRWISHTKASHAELLVFSWICVWIKGWANNREAGDLRRYCAHYDVMGCGRDRVSLLIIMHEEFEEEYIFKPPKSPNMIEHIDGLVHDCSNPWAFAMKLLLSCAKTSVWCI